MVGGWQVGNEFSSVEALWSQFENVMAKDGEGEGEEEESQAQAGGAQTTTVGDRSEAEGGEDTTVGDQTNRSEGGE